MNEQTEQLIRELADKLGTTAEHLWGVLVTQALIAGVVESLFIVCFGAVIFSLYIFVKGKTTKRPGTATSYPRADWEDEGAIFAWLFVGVLAISFLILVGTNASMTLAALLNPEYWALMQVLGK